MAKSDKSRVDRNCGNACKADEPTKQQIMHKALGTPSLLKGL